MSKTMFTSLIGLAALLSFTVACQPAKKKEDDVAKKVVGASTAQSADGTINFKFGDVKKPVLSGSDLATTENLIFATIDAKVIINDRSDDIVTVIRMDQGYGYQLVNTGSDAYTAIADSQCSVPNCATFDMMITIKKGSEITMQAGVRRSGDTIKYNYIKSAPFASDIKQMGVQLEALK